MGGSGKEAGEDINERTESKSSTLDEEGTRATTTTTGTTAFPFSTRATAESTAAKSTTVARSAATSPAATATARISSSRATPTGTIWTANASWGAATNAATADGTSRNATRWQDASRSSASTERKSGGKEKEESNVVGVDLTGSCNRNNLPHYSGVLFH
jgi:aspartate/tyrosine/aromatic aminotransferase